LEYNGTMYDNVWDSIEQFWPYIGIQKSEFTVHINNPFSRDFSELARLGKAFLESCGYYYYAVVLLAAVILCTVLVARWPRGSIEPEIILTCVGLFILSYALAIALSISFDLGRYVSGMVPLTILWFLIAAMYIIYRLVVMAMHLLRRARGDILRPSE